MKNPDEFRTFYETTLIGDLKVIEEQRKNVAENVIILSICGSIIILLLLISFRIPRLLPFSIPAMILTVGLWMALYKLLTKNYVSNFKTRIIENIIRFADDHLEYQPYDRIPESVYLSSGIFPRKPDIYRGGNLVKGKLGLTEVMFSDVHSQTKRETSDSNGKETTTYHTIFQGIFFVADFNKHFSGMTFVLPNVARKFFGNVLGSMFQSWNTRRGELIKMEDPAFEKLFVVYGTDQIEARYILSTTLMSNITDFREKTNLNIFLSFANDKIFVAISHKKPLFQPKIFRTVLDFELIRGYYTVLLFMVGIADQLNLHTRIWGKQ